MNEEAMRQALRQCLSLKGTEILADTRQFKGVIQDMLPGYNLQKERNLLIIAAESFSLSKRLLEAPPDGTARQFFCENLLKEITENGLSPEAASAVLQCFAEALGWKVKIAAGKGALSVQPPAGAAACLHKHIDFAGFRCRDCGQRLYGLYGGGRYTPYEQLRKKERNGLLLTVNENCAGTLVLPEHITALGDDSLSEQQELQEVVLPASLLSVGSYAFDNCPALKSLNVPDSAISIGEGAFRGLKRVYYRGTAAGSPWGADEHITSGPPPVNAPSSAPSLNSQLQQPAQPLVSPRAFIAYNAGDSFAYNCHSDIKEVVIPDGVKFIGNYAFNGCTNLQSAVIPYSVVSIGEAAFQGCASLKNIVIPGGVTSIGQGAFYGCAELKNIFIPDSVNYIGQGAFMSSGLTSVRLPEGITVISSSAFAHCLGLTDVYIPESVITIKEYAFHGCSGLFSLKVPDGVMTIEQGAFAGVRRLHYDGPASGSPWGALNHIKSGPALSPGLRPAPFAYEESGGLKELIIPDDILDLEKYKKS